MPQEQHETIEGHANHIEIHLMIECPYAMDTPDNIGYQQGRFVQWKINLKGFDILISVRFEK